MFQKSLEHCECNKVFNEFGELVVNRDLYVMLLGRKSRARFGISSHRWHGVLLQVVLMYEKSWYIENASQSY
jgi:hypothetical protein